MSILDGFLFWLGKMLAELAFGLVGLALFVSVALVIVLWPRKRGKKAAK